MTSQEKAKIKEKNYSPQLTFYPTASESLTLGGHQEFPQLFNSSTSLRHVTQGGHHSSGNSVNVTLFSYV